LSFKITNDKLLVTASRLLKVWTSCARCHHNMPHPCKLTFDLLILKVVSESRVTWTTSVPILVFLGLLVCSRLRPYVAYATDR